MRATAEWLSCAELVFQQELFQVEDHSDLAVPGSDLELSTGCVWKARLAFTGADSHIGFVMYDVQKIDYFFLKRPMRDWNIDPASLSRCLREFKVFELVFPAAVSFKFLK